MFRCPPSFRVFAAQNPLREGGGRKGLPRSFLNRFTRVTVESMGNADLEAVRESLARQWPNRGLLCMRASSEASARLIMCCTPAKLRGATMNHNAPLRTVASADLPV